MTIDKKILSGDEMMYIMVKDMIKKGKIPKIACSVMTNPGTIESFNKIGVSTIETKVGDSNLVEVIKKGKAEIGFEPSGHFIFNFSDNILLGDGLLITKKIIDILSIYSIDKIKSWIDEIRLIPMKTENLKIDKMVLEDKKVRECINVITKNKQMSDKILIRASGTENLIRVTVGMRDQRSLENTLMSIKKCIVGGIN